jgi:hypothetical protein
MARHLFSFASFSGAAPRTFPQSARSREHPHGGCYFTSVGGCARYCLFSCVALLTDAAGMPGRDGRLMAALGKMRRRRSGDSTAATPIGSAVVGASSQTNQEPDDIDALEGVVKRILSDVTGGRVHIEGERVDRVHAYTDFTLSPDSCSGNNRKAIERYIQQRLDPTAFETWNTSVEVQLEAQEAHWPKAHTRMVTTLIIRAHARPARFTALRWWIGRLSFWTRVALLFVLFALLLLLLRTRFHLW